MRRKRAERVWDGVFAHYGVCQQECDLLRQLEDLKASERTMYELDHAKNQTMTVLKLALANLVLWARDHSFPAS